jgi:hypothetical protein
MQQSIMSKEVAPRIGHVREDGRVYNGKNPCFKSGEHWATMESFFKRRGASWYEKRAIMDKNVKERALKKEAAAKRAIEAKAIRDEKERLKLLSPKRKKLTIEEKTQRNREAQRRYYLKKNQTKIEARKKVKLAKVIENEAKRAEKAKLSSEKALAKSLRPKRIVLTDEQRAEARRQEKRNYKHARRARINNCDVRATPKMVEEARKQAGDRCYYCGKKAELTLDHFEPLAKGGAHCVSNFVFCCHSCNSRKRDLDPFDFMASNLAVSF